jgi:hypothetical protein
MGMEHLLRLLVLSKAQGMGEYGRAMGYGVYGWLELGLTKCSKTRCCVCVGCVWGGAHRGALTLSTRLPSEREQALPATTAKTNSNNEI